MPRDPKDPGRLRGSALYARRARGRQAAHDQHDREDERNMAEPSPDRCERDRPEPGPRRTLPQIDRDQGHEERQCDEAVEREIAGSPEPGLELRLDPHARQEQVGQAESRPEQRDHPGGGHVYSPGADAARSAIRGARGWGWGWG